MVSGILNVDRKERRRAAGEHPGRGEQAESRTQPRGRRAFQETDTETVSGGSLSVAGIGGVNLLLLVCRRCRSQGVMQARARAFGSSCVRISDV